MWIWVAPASVQAMVGSSNSWIISRYPNIDFNKPAGDYLNILNEIIDVFKTYQLQERVGRLNIEKAAIILMTLLGREAPDLPPDVIFSDLEIKVLKAVAIKKTAIT